MLNAVLSAESSSRTAMCQDTRSYRRSAGRADLCDLGRERSHLHFLERGGTWRDRMGQNGTDWTRETSQRRVRLASGQRRDRKEAKFKSGSCRGTILSENFHKISRRNLPCLNSCLIFSVKVLAGWTISEKW